MDKNTNYTDVKKITGSEQIVFQKHLAKVAHLKNQVYSLLIGLHGVEFFL